MWSCADHIPSVESKWSPQVRPVMGLALTLTIRISVWNLETFHTISAKLYSQCSKYTCIANGNPSKNKTEPKAMLEFWHAPLQDLSPVGLALGWVPKLDFKLVASHCAHFRPQLQHLLKCTLVERSSSVVRPEISTMKPSLGRTPVPAIPYRRYSALLLFLTSYRQSPYPTAFSTALIDLLP